MGTLRCDLSGSFDLNSFLHLYKYKDLDHRDEIRRRSGLDERWQSYLKEAKPMFAAQRSSIYTPAKGVLAAVATELEIAPASHSNDKLPMVEFRRYKFRAGYDTVPKALKALETALPAKVAAARDAGIDHDLDLIGYTDVGRLNELVESWRYSSAGDCVRARQASRNVGVWRRCVEDLAEMTVEFDTSFLYDC